MKIKSFEFSKNAQKHSIDYGVAIATQTGYETVDDVRTKYVRITVWAGGEAISTTKTQLVEKEASLTFGDT